MTLLNRTANEAANGLDIGYLIKSKDLESMAREGVLEVEYETISADNEGQWFWVKGRKGDKWPGQKGKFRTRARLISQWMEVEYDPDA